MLRLDRYLSELGIGTRSEIKQLVRGGRISVDGVENITNDMKIDEETADVYFDGEKLFYKKYIYLLMNKPRGFICATFSPDGRERTVIDILPEKYRRLGLFPVGRLDKDTAGLLLLTNDGGFSHNLTSPKKSVAKTYYAVVDGDVSSKEKKAFSGGLHIGEGEICKPAELMTLDEYAENNGGWDIKKLCRKNSVGGTRITDTHKISEVIVIITEGKYHQVKRMFEAVGSRVLYLKRIALGEYCLPYDLEEGAVYEL